MVECERELIRVNLCSKKLHPEQEILAVEQKKLPRRKSKRTDWRDAVKKRCLLIKAESYRRAHIRARGGGEGN